MDHTIYVAKTKALISFAVTAKLICVFFFAYAKCWFSHDAAHFSFFLVSSSNGPGSIHHNLFINTIVGVEASSCVSYHIRAIKRVKCIVIKENQFESSTGPCYIQNFVITKCVIQRFRCMYVYPR